MDFGVLGFDPGLVAGSESTTGFASDPQTATKHHKWYGSGSGSGSAINNNNNNQDNSRSVPKSDLDLRGSNTKLPRTDAAPDFSASRRSNAEAHHHQSQMLSFSSAPKSEPNLTFTGYNNRNTGFNGGNMHGGGGGAAGRGPLTPCQWMELQHQALIYKYITENVPVPTNLLIPIRKAFDSVQLSAYSGGFLRPNTYGWGTFHLGFAGNSTDPEPGRCRRTDGKKWRCSRDAVADQKYCERHLNRGRHRSRKPVEGQFGHSAAAKAAAATTTAATTSNKLTDAPLVAFGSSGGSGNAFNCLNITQQQQLKNLQSGGSSNLTPATTLDRMFLSKENVDENAASFSILSPTTMDMKTGENCFMVSKQALNFEETSKNQFGIVSSDALRNPSQKNSALINCRSFGSSSSNHSNKETESQNPLRQFMDDWPKIQSNCSSVSWPEVDAQSETTQLSIAMPMAASDFMSSTSSPNNEKATVLSPLRLSREFNPIKMGLGVGNSMSESDQRQANWVPVSWESCMGGPLGEVLHSTNHSIASSKNSSSLNLMTEGWDGSPRVGSSPTGVLQKASYNSLSNSSTGSSPRAENSRTLCNDLLGSTLVRSLPAS